MLLLLVPALLAVVVVDSMPYGDYDGVDVCSRPFRLVYWNNVAGMTFKGDKAALKDAVLRGATVRVVISTTAGDTFSSGVNNINTRGMEVCANLVDQVTPTNTTAFELRASSHWTYQIVCTNGKMAVVTHVVDENTSQGSVDTKAAVKWYVRSSSPRQGESTPIYSHFMDGGEVGGDLAALAAAALRGKDMKVVRRGLGYVTNLDLVQVTTSGLVVNGQNVRDVGQSYTADSVTFNRRMPYKWLSSWYTSGRRYNQRYDYGGDTVVVHNDDNVALDWYVDPCWRLVFTSNAQGYPAQGTVEDLIRAIEAGHRVRVKQRNNKVMNPSLIEVTKSRNGVRVQLLHEVQQECHDAQTCLNSPGREFDFTTNTQWVLTVLDTSSRVVKDFYYYGNNTRSATRSVTWEEVSWYVDSRPWTVAYALDDTSVLARGTKLDFKKAVEAGASVRAKITFAHKLNDMYVEGVATYLGHGLGDKTVVQLEKHLLIDDPIVETSPQWMFLLAAIDGQTKFSTYKYGTSASFLTEGIAQTAMTYFVDNHVPSL